MPDGARLITIPFSHFCEKARWALERAGYTFREEAHAPGFHKFPVKRTGAKGSTPVLVTKEGRVLDDSSLILELIGDRAGLWNVPSKTEALDWMARFDRHLGPDVRRVAYDDLLGRRADALRVFRCGAPSWEGTAVGVVFPILRPLMRSSMRIRAEDVARSRARLESLYDEVSALLVDGRRWLLGDTFSAADLTFAALSAPAVAPEPYRARVDDVRFGPELEAWFARLCDSPAGELARRAYAEERAKVVS